MNTLTLKKEIQSDPLNRGYASMRDEQVAESLTNTIDRTRNLNSLTGDQVFQATDPKEWTLLLDPNKQLWVSFCSRASIDPFGAANVALVRGLFGQASKTVTNLQAMRTEDISRGEELGLTRLSSGHVAQARQQIAEETAEREAKEEVI